MKGFFLAFLGICLTVNLWGQGMDFFPGHWTDALKLAQEEDKIVFVDAYAEWCGPCKMMARTVFVDDEVGEFYNENFVNMQIDMEKGQGLEFGKKYPATAYPTLYFLTPEGEVLHKAVGAKDSKNFIQLGKLAIRNYDKSADFAKAYDKGNRDYELVLNYIKALNKVEKSSLKIANDYINSEPGISDEQLAVLLYEATTEADSRIFDLMIENRKELDGIYTEEEIRDKIESACLRTIDKAIQFESYFLVEESKTKMKSHYKPASRKFDIEADMIYSEGIGDIRNYIQNVSEYCREIIDDNPEELNNYAILLSRSYKDRKEAMELSESISEKSVKLEENVDYLMTYSKILVTNGKREKALETALKALELARLEGKPTRQVDGLIRYLESL